MVRYGSAVAGTRKSTPYFASPQSFTFENCVISLGVYTASSSEVSWFDGFPTFPKQRRISNARTFEQERRGDLKQPVQSNNDLCLGYYTSVSSLEELDLTGCNFSHQSRRRRGRNERVARVLRDNSHFTEEERERDEDPVLWHIREENEGSKEDADLKQSPAPATSAFLPISSFYLPSWSFLVWVFQQHTRLKCVVLGGCQGVTDEDIRVLLLCGSQNTLTKLSVRGCTDVTDTSLTLALKSCPKLMYLDARDCPRPTDTSISTAVGWGHKLVEVNFEGCKNISKKALAVLRSSGVDGRCPHLARVNGRQLALRHSPTIAVTDVSRVGTPAANGLAHKKTQKNTQHCRLSRQRLAKLCNPHKGCGVKEFNSTQPKIRYCCSIYHTGFKQYPQYM